MSNHNMNGDPMDDWRFGFEVKSAQIGAAEVGQGVTYTIDDVEFRKIGDGRDARMRPVIKLRESDLDWVTCKTTLFCVEALYGRSPRGWVGKPITLYWDPDVKFGRDTVGGVRVKGAPGIRPMTVTIKLPKKKDQKVRLIDTAPAPTITPEEARAKFLAYAEGKGVTPKDVAAYLAQWNTTLDALCADDLRRLAGDIGKIAEYTKTAADGGDGESGESGDGDGEWQDAE